MAAQAPGLMRKLVTVPDGPVAFTGVRLFDADATRFLADQTVVVDQRLDCRGRRPANRLPSRPARALSTAVARP